MRRPGARRPAKQPKPPGGQSAVAPDPRAKAITDFDWRIYADATLAGLAVLIPIPFVDTIIEEYFRRRMPRDIARFNGRTLAPRVVFALNRRQSNYLLGCLMLPFRAIVYLIRNIYRTILYALTIKDASDNLSKFWHQAFLINYMIRQGHLDDQTDVDAPIAAYHQTLAGVTTSPLIQLAQEVIGLWRQGVVRARTLIGYARRREETQEIKDTRREMATAWGDFREYLLQVAARYDENYAMLRRQQELHQAIQVGESKPLTGGEDVGDLNLQAGQDALSGQDVATGQ